MLGSFFILSVFWASGSLPLPSFTNSTAPLALAQGGTGSFSFDKYLLDPATNINPHQVRGGGGVKVEDDRALSGMGGASELVYPETNENDTGEISIYVVREGDTLSEIAQMFGVTTNTIRWANNIAPDEYIQKEQVLIILPIPGVRYTIEKGDTISSIAEEFDADPTEIKHYNRLADADLLSAGMEIIIPHGEISPPPQTSSASTPSPKMRSTASSRSVPGYFIAPLSSYTKTQGLHGYNAVDLAASIGAPVYAAASGEVIISRGGGGWNGGYGDYVVIRHPNGTQTLYAHMHSVIVGLGNVVQGQVIGYVGSRGNSTGPHLHFEVRGGTNPF